jgi:hypothetical protein
MFVGVATANLEHVADVVSAEAAALVDVRVVSNIIVQVRLQLDLESYSV